MSFTVQLRRAAELDVAEAQIWYDTQRSGLGGDFHSEVSQVFTRLAENPFIYPVVYREVRRVIVRRFPYLVWFRIVGEDVTVLACTHARQEPGKAISRFR